MKKYDIEPYKDEEFYEREDAYIRAKKKLDKLVGFYWHLAVYIVINIFLIIVIGTNRDDGEFWSFGTFATAFFWGIGLAFHFLGVFGPGFLFGRNWEERKIREFMEKDRRKWQ